MENERRFEENLSLFKDQKDNDNYFDYFNENIVEDPSPFQESSIRTEFNIAFQMKIAMDFLLKARSKLSENGISHRDTLLLDVGSKFSEALAFSLYFPTIFTECRNPTERGDIMSIPGLNLAILNAEAQDIYRHLDRNREKIRIVTSLHAMEHFGLGRYGDNIDYFGDQKALSEFSKILEKKPSFFSSSSSNGGFLILSVPFTIHNSPRVEFHGQRVYNFKTIESMLKRQNMKILEEAFIFPLGGIRGNNNEVLAPIVRDRKMIIDAEKREETEITKNDTGVYITLSQQF